MLSALYNCSLSIGLRFGMRGGGLCFDFKSPATTMASRQELCYSNSTVQLELSRKCRWNDMLWLTLNYACFFIYFLFNPFFNLFWFRGQTRCAATEITALPPPPPPQSWVVKFMKHAKKHTKHRIGKQSRKSNGGRSDQIFHIRSFNRLRAVVVQCSDEASFKWVALALLGIPTLYSVAINITRHSSLIEQ